MRNNDNLKVRKKEASRRTSRLSVAKEFEAYQLQVEVEIEEKRTYDYIKAMEVARKAASFNLPLRPRFDLDSMLDGRD